jgi:hypothetical protein
MIPIEWLRGLDENEGGYAALLDEAGSLAVAAFKLAKARCQVWATPTEVPTSRELRAAARVIAERVGLPRVPDVAFLARECEAQGLPVL